MVSFPTQTPDCVSRNLSLFHLFLFPDASICTAMAVPTLENFDHVIVSVYNNFPVNSNQDDPFNCIAYDYSRPEWDSLCNLLRDVPWEEIFKLSVSDAAS